jgi:hypothetical protein
MHSHAAFGWNGQGFARKRGWAVLISMASSGGLPGMTTGLSGDFLGQAFGIGFLREDAAARFSAILAKPACDG